MPTKEIHVQDEDGATFVVVETSFDGARSVNGPEGFREEHPSPKYTVHVRGAFLYDVEPQDDGSFISVGKSKRYTPV